jgi:hypothetical protein
MNSYSKPKLKVDWASHQAVAFSCKNWHYSKSVPVPPLVKIGAWENGQFIGVILFSRGANNNLYKPYGLQQTEGCELTRVALRNHKLPVSKIMRHAITFLKKKCPGLKLIISFADPNQGHHGGIYQAGNWLYAGKTSPSKQYFDKFGRQWHPRMIKPTGWTVVNGIKRKCLKPDQCTSISVPGKHRYLYPLTKEMHAKIQPLAQPYPKREKQANVGTTDTATEHHRSSRSNPSKASTKIQDAD